MLLQAGYPLDSRDIRGIRNHLARYTQVKEALGNYEQYNHSLQNKCRLQIRMSITKAAALRRHAHIVRGPGEQPEYTHPTITVQEEQFDDLPLPKSLINFIKWEGADKIVIPDRWMTSSNLHFAITQARAYQQSRAAREHAIRRGRMSRNSTGPTPQIHEVNIGGLRILTTANPGEATVEYDSAEDDDEDEEPRERRDSFG